MIKKEYKQELLSTLRVDDLDIYMVGDSESITCKVYLNKDVYGWDFKYESGTFLGFHSFDTVYFLEYFVDNYLHDMESLIKMDILKSLGDHISNNDYEKFIKVPLELRNE